MTVSLKAHHSFSKQRSLKPSKTQKNHSLEPSQLFEAGSSPVETHLGSVLVLTEDYEVLYATDSLQSPLKELAEVGEGGRITSEKIILICQVLQQCRDSFPEQNWSIEFDIVTKDATALRIRSRWFKLDSVDRPCILLVAEDRQQFRQDMLVYDGAQDWGLTGREQEVWLLNQAGYTYRQTAEKLYITLNTVKKHMRSIHAKRKAHAPLDSSEN